MLGFPRLSEYSVNSAEYSFQLIVKTSFSRQSLHMVETSLCSMQEATSFATNHGSLSRITMRISPKREHEKTCRANDDVVTTFSVMALSPICKAVDVARQTTHFAVGLFFYGLYHRTGESAIIQSTFEQKESHDNLSLSWLVF